MIVSISQPAYLPWLGYIERIAISDLHIVLDHVQLEKRSFTSRNKVRTAHGWKWLSVPIRITGPSHSLCINQAEIAKESDWRKDHKMTIQSAYGKAPYFPQYNSFIDQFYAKDWTMLSDVCSEMTSFLLAELNVKTPIKFSSQMGITSVKNKLILDLCKEVGCTKYISGPFGRDYLSVQDFEANNIELLFHDYVHPQYKQCFEPFEPNMSVIDLLFNHGNRSLEILKTSNLDLA